MTDNFDAKARLFLNAKNILTAENILKNLTDTGIDKLRRLLDGDIVSNEKNFFLEFFESFTEKVPAWLQPETLGDDLTSKKRKAESGDIVNLFWRQFSYSQIRRIMIIRKQNSGLCYLHGPVVMEHYLIAIATNGENSSTYDLGRYEAHILDPEGISNLLLNDKGGNSQRALREICGLKTCDTLRCNIPNKTFFRGSYDEICEIILKRLALEPALISTFKVYPDFKRRDGFSFTEPPDFSCDEPSMHSMVLIGARKTSAGDYFFLLQNWWEGRYFIEVSAEYLHHCDATITFVNKAVFRKCELSGLLCEALYAETSVDAPEGAFFEY